jgi:hypothetical protein
MELVKHQHYDEVCATTEFQLRPVCVDTFGAWGPEAYGTFKRIAAGLSKRNGLSFGMQYQLVLLEVNSRLMTRLAQLMLVNAGLDPERPAPPQEAQDLLSDTSSISSAERGTDNAGSAMWIPRGQEQHASRLVDTWVRRGRMPSQHELESLNANRPPTTDTTDTTNANSTKTRSTWANPFTDMVNDCATINTNANATNTTNTNATNNANANATTETSACNAPLLHPAAAVTHDTAASTTTATSTTTTTTPKRPREDTPAPLTLRGIATSTSTKQPPSPLPEALGGNLNGTHFVTPKKRPSSSDTCSRRLDTDEPSHAHKKALTGDSPSQTGFSNIKSQPHIATEARPVDSVFSFGRPLLSSRTSPVRASTTTSGQNLDNSRSKMHETSPFKWFERHV